MSRGYEPLDYAAPEQKLLNGPVPSLATAQGLAHSAENLIPAIASGNLNSIASIMAAIERHLATLKADPLVAKALLQTTPNQN